MGEESPKATSAPTGAVFLSYASQDACGASGASERDVRMLQTVLRRFQIHCREVCRRPRCAARGCATKVFEANCDQLKDPNKISPGQKLRIP